MTQRRNAIRSKAIREAARGEECTLQIFGVCVGGTDTTVFCHLSDESFGRGEKGDDSSGVFGCFGCHNEIDGRTRKTKGEDLTWYKLRALQRTTRRLIEKKVYPVKLDTEKPLSERATPPRKPPEQRRKILPGRPLQSRNDLKREARK